MTFKTEIKRMEALVKESKRHAKEEEKKKKGLRVRLGQAKILGKSYSRKKTGRSDGFAGWLLLSLERSQLHVCISSQKWPPNQARMDPWPSER